ncbi:MAG: exopolysaccharide biosynthesis polyprenyl glycosylphosphotransferase [Clostridiales bacterium]|nr:exopolysaccharide biosynthesis polyprenyl glycosylphosphotransferase [Clostridiales bacterium]
MLLKKIIIKFQHTIILLLKLALYVGLFAIFFLILGASNRQLLVPSRTAGVTMVTFVAVGLGMLAAYGGYDIGKKKSKPIIYSLGLATFLTDMVTWLELNIMNVNANNNESFQPDYIGQLILIILLQVAFIVMMAYLGNYIFFRINRPEKSIIITGSLDSLNQIYSGVRKFKLQYDVEYMMDYRDPEVLSCIEKCDTVFLYDIPVERRTELVEYCYRLMKNIYFNPEIADIVEINANHVVVDDISMICAGVKEFSLEQRIFKRTMDIVLSLVILVLTSPLWLASAIAIKACDGGPVFFKQSRATKGGRVFQLYKFRTMRENAENHSVTSEDDRITPVGKVLRKFRIDELPQLLNILKNDMSLVGPRPEMLENVYIYTKELPEFEYRLRVKAGLTGYAQIAGKYNTSPKDKLILDLMYIEQYSIWKDIKLLFQTLIVLFKADSTEAFEKKGPREVVDYRKPGKKDGRKG